MTEEQGWRDLGERITRLETLVGEIPGRINEQITARDNATRQLVAFNQERLAQLQNDTVKLTSMVDSLHKRVDQGDHTTGTLKLQQPSLEARIETLEGVVTTRAEEARVDKVEAEVQAVKNELVTRQAEQRGRDRAVTLAAKIITFVVTVAGGALTLNSLGVI